MSMNIQIVSDLHIEYKNDNIPDPLEFIIPSAKILVLAGDIGSLYKIKQLEGFLLKLCPHFEVVIYIPGNHEYYMTQNIQPLPMYKLIDRLFEIEKRIPNLYILNQTSVVIANVCFTGCTLWSNAQVNIPKFIVRIHGMNNEIYRKKFESDVKYINNMIEYCHKNDLKLVVMTHYCPTYEIINEYKKKDKFISLYVSELDHLLDKQKISVWCCGHIHRNFDIISKGGTRVVGNQRGKPRDKIRDFKKDCVIQID